MARPYYSDCVRKSHLKENILDFDCLNHNNEHNSKDRNMKIEDAIAVSEIVVFILINTVQSLLIWSFYRTQNLLFHIKSDRNFYLPRFFHFLISLINNKYYI